jgi:hypothetical protein
LIRPSTEYNIEPRNPWTETLYPVSSDTSRLAAASARSPGLTCLLEGPRTCPFAIARLRSAVWSLPVRQFRPQPESARPPPNQSYQCYAGRTRAEQVESSREQTAAPGLIAKQ